MKESGIKSKAQVIMEIKSMDLSSLGVSEKEILLIDYGSLDKTVEKASMVIPIARVIRHVKEGDVLLRYNSFIYKKLQCP